MNGPSASNLFYSIALLISIARSEKKQRTFFYSMGASIVTSIAMLFWLFFLPLSNSVALGHLASDIGDLVGIITAFVYSTKTRERTPKSVYLVAISCAIISLMVIAFASF